MLLTDKEMDEDMSTTGTPCMIVEQGNSKQSVRGKAPLPDRKHFRHVFVPSVNFPLFITRASLVLMPSWDFFDCKITQVRQFLEPTDS